MRACRHEHLRRSRRRPWERLYGLIRLRPYRCSLCHKRMLRYAGRPWLELPLLAAAMVLAVLFWRESVPSAASSRAAAPEPPSAGPVPEAPAAALAERTQPAPTSRVAAERSAQSLASASPSPAPPITPTPAPLRDVRQAPQGGKTGVPARVPSAPAGPPRLHSLSAHEGDSRFLLELAHDGARIEPRMIRLANPPRLILDLPGDWQAEKTLLQRQLIDGDIVRRVRVGLHPEKLRIVVDLGSAQDLRQKLETAAGRLELSLLPAGGD